MFSRIGLAIVFALPAFLARGEEAPPKTWIDPDTGHRVVRLTDEPNSASLYFNQNGYTADGRKMVYTTPDGISALDLETHATKSVVKGQFGRWPVRPFDGATRAHADDVVAAQAAFVEPRGRDPDIAVVFAYGEVAARRGGHAVAVDALNGL